MLLSDEKRKPGSYRNLDGRALPKPGIDPYVCLHRMPNLHIILAQLEYMR